MRSRFFLQNVVLGQEHCDAVIPNPPPPRVVEFQTTTLCNARCRVCPWPETRGMGRARTMADATWTRLVEGLTDLRPRRVIPYLNNEPLIDTALESRIRTLCDALGEPEIEVSTNGLLLTPARSLALADAGVTELLVSIFGHDGPSHWDLMRLPYDRVAANVISSIGALRAADSRLRIKVIKLAAAGVGQDELDSDIARWRGLGVEVDVYGYLDRAGNVMKNAVSAFQRDSRLAPKGCELYRHRERMYVLTDGSVLFCCHDWREQFVVGNIMSSSLRTIWESPAYELVRRQVDGAVGSSPDFLCRRCKLSPTR
jgi:radical SAM protein with 4Fe4S-binding SPASM domain